MLTRVETPQKKPLEAKTLVNFSKIGLKRHSTHFVGRPLFRLISNHMQAESKLMVKVSELGRQISRLYQRHELQDNISGLHGSSSNL